jgi:hypothetical protein
MRFTLRDLFWLTAVAGLSIGWFLDHRWDEEVEANVAGVVTAVSGNLVEVSLGSDDGLQRGNEMQLYRANAHLGRVTITVTSPDRAVGQLAPFHEKVQKGDKAMANIAISKSGCGMPQ